MTHEHIFDPKFVPKMITNFENSLYLRFNVIFSIQILCQTMKLATVLQFNQKVGPLLKIVQKMAQDYLNFMVIYFVLVLMFSILGNLNFVNASSFGTLFDATMTMMDASMGNFDFSIWDEIEDPI